MTYADVNGQRLYYEDSGGDGPAVVLSHGFLMDHEMFAPQVTALAPEFRVITWDERGFGDTEFDGKPFTYWDSARDCLGLLDHLGIEQAVLGGMSQGGYLSLRAALLAPERVRALVLIATQSDLESPEKIPLYQAMFDAWAAEGPSDAMAAAVAGIIVADPAHDPLARRWIAKWQARPPELIVEPGRCLLEREDDVSRRLSEITCPAMVFHGTEDTAIPMASAERLAAGLPGCDGVVAIQGAGHASNLTHPGEVNPPLLAFLRGL
ncbi:MAG TPA: alpha/beta hydrolase [Acidimicrobiia bacterium]|jgi:pimeloyl-ACP methyl ester carboxylesterase|nr:alpha/beta hydrolase [Acidimicrobiia bacterium]